MSDIPLAIPVVAAAALSTCLQLRAEYRGPRWQVYLFKPLATALLLGFAALSTAAHGAGFQQAIVIGLSCSLIGDVLLMLPRDRFVAGLASFLLAHLAYLAAFATEVPIGAHPALALPLVAAAVPALRLLWPGLGPQRIPVLLYAAAILLMVWQAWGWSWALPSLGSTFAAVGATLFLVSDATLAFNRFRRPFGSAQTLIMSSYVAAQALIACSVGTQ
jgi:uncharacterized membrane protein YhhN